jgi:hypothetical protein
VERTLEMAELRVGFGAELLAPNRRFIFRWSKDVDCRSSKGCDPGESRAETWACSGSRAAKLSQYPS